MKRTVLLLEPAENEFIDAIDYYNQQSPGLGYEFAVEINKAIERIVKYPESWTNLSERSRKCRCNRFPYNVIYFLHNDTIIIIAIMHTKRKPDNWIERLK
jgi:toxin ParE1/3/4